jgi:hypothetical protein
MNVQAPFIVLEMATLADAERIGQLEVFPGSGPPRLVRSWGQRGQVAGSSGIALAWTTLE